MHSISQLKSKWLTIRKYCWFAVPFCRILLFGMEAYGGSQIDANDANRALVAPLSGIDGGTDYTIYACPGTSLCFDIFPTASFPDKKLSLDWNHSIADAIFESSPESKTSGHFCWIIPNDAGRTEAYTFSVFLKSDEHPEYIEQTITYSIVVPQIVISSEINHSLCEGVNNGSIKVSVTGGQSPYTFDWQELTLHTPYADHLPAGIYSVTVTDDNGCAASATDVIDVREKLEVIPNSTPATCHSADGSIQLNINGGYPPYNSVCHGSNPNGSGLDGLTAGTYSIRVTDSKGCLNTQKVEVDDLAPKLTVTAQKPVQCKGGSDGMLYVEGIGRSALIYSWEPNHANGPKLKNLTSGTYTVTATDMEGCSTQLRTEITYEHENPAVSLGTDRLLCVGEKLVLDAGNFDAYQWTDNSRSREYKADHSDTYSVVVTDQFGCQSVDAVRLDFIDCSKPDEFNSINLYPSPARDKATVSMVSDNEEQAVFQIHDLLGKLIWQKEIQAKGEIREEISTCNWEEGIYILRVIKDGRISTQKFMKQ